MAYKRYRGNSGQYERINDPDIIQSTAVPVLEARRPLENQHERQIQDPPHQSETQESQVSGNADRNPVGNQDVEPMGIGSDADSVENSETPKDKPKNSLLSGGFGDILGSLSDKLNPANLESEDILIMLILYLLYRESGDTELLIIMAAMLLL